jgi:hypothetical protein
MKTLGIYTKDFSIYHDILKALRRRKLAYVSLSSSNNIPKRIGVILTSKKDGKYLKSQKIITVDEYDSIDYAIDKAMQKLTGKEVYSKIFIGIDPGERPGIAIVGDNILLQKIQIDSPEDVVTSIMHFLKIYLSKEVYIRIGHGSIINRNRIINSLIPLKIPIEIVDETSTTPSQQKGRFNRNKEAAAAIALLSGGKVQTHLPLEPSRGSIKNVQEQSRKLTEGKYTISEETAQRVLKGQLNLAEAIKKEKPKK